MPELQYCDARAVWCLDDGGYRWWWIATSADDAKTQHIKLNYTDAGVPLDEEDISVPCKVPAAEVLMVNDYGPNGERADHTAQLWAQIETGLLASDI